MAQKEMERLVAVNRFLTLQISKEKELEEIVRLAAEICGTPTALITLIGQDTQYIRFKLGFDKETTRREDAFCNHAIQQPDIMVVPDALEDERFVQNVLVTGQPNIRFYAGAPLTTTDGHNLGSLCVIDQTPRRLTAHQQQMLQVLSRQVIHLLEFDASLQILKNQFIETKSAEDKLRSFFESSSTCHLLMDVELKVMAFNKALNGFIIRTYGKEVSVGMNVTDYIHEAYIEDFVANCQKALSGTSIQIERLLNYPNEAIWWQISYDPARNADGEIIGISYNATDITKRVEQEQTVLAQNESLRQIAHIQSHELRRPVASIMGLMNLLKLDGHCDTIPELELMDHAVEELDEKIRLIVDYSAYLPTKDVAEYKPQSSLIASDEKERIGTLAELNLDYSRLEHHLKDLTLLATKVTGTSVSMVNLIDAYNQWTVAQQGSVCAVIDRDESVCKYTIAERAALEIKDLTADERFSHLPLVRKEGFRYYYGVPLKTAEGHHLGALCVLDGQPRELSPSQKEILQLISKEVVSRLYDIKEKEQLHRQMAEVVGRQKSVAHDIRGPIAGIIGLAQLACDQKETSRTEEMLEYMDLIKKSGMSLLALVSGMLEPNTGEINALSASHQTVTLHALKEETVSLFAPQAQHKDITFTVKTNGAKDEVSFYKDNFLQIITNLVSNALKFTPAGGHVNVDLGLNDASDSQTLLISVSDTGTGMESETIASVLNDSAGSKQGTSGEVGFGLGLGLVKKLVAAHEGTIAFHSKQGEGTTFDVVIPLKELK